MQNEKTRYKLTNDYIFKKVFAKDENNGELKDLLEAILEIEIQKVEVKNPELPKDALDEKLSILDIKAQINEDTIIDIEMQVTNKYNIGERSSLYLSKLVAGQLSASQEYKKLKKAISINILNFNYFETNTYHNVAHMKFEETREDKYVDMGYEREQQIATPKLEMHFIELPKFIKKNAGTNTKLEQWLWLLAGKEEKIKMAEKENFELSKAIEELKRMNLTETEEEVYEARQKAIWDYNSQMLAAKEDGFEQGKEEGLKVGKEEGLKVGKEEGLKEGKEEGLKVGKEKGLEEGIKEGIKKGKISIVKKLLKKGMTIEEISEITEIAKEEIEEIKKENK